MTDKIIALVDGSIHSASVCEHAAWAALRTGAAVELLHVLDRRETPHTRDLSGSIRLGARTALLQELASLDEQRAKLVAHRGRAILQDARAILDQAGVLEITTRLRHGDIVETLAEQERDASLILIGKRGESGDPTKDQLGSNLERIVRACHRPVLVADQTFRPIEKLLLAYDGSAGAMKAVDHVARSPMLAGLAVRVVTVGSDSPELRKGLDDAAAMLRASGFKPETTVVAGEPPKVLAQVVIEAGLDLVVMGAYGHSRIRSLIIGSTTSAMIRACPVSLLLVR